MDILCYVIIALLILYVGLPLLAILLVNTMEACATMSRDCRKVAETLMRLGVPIEYIIPAVLGITPFVLLALALLR
jgi:hypothetical protein